MPTVVVVERLVAPDSFASTVAVVSFVLQVLRLATTNAWTPKQTMPTVGPVVEYVQEVNLAKVVHANALRA